MSTCAAVGEGQPPAAGADAAVAAPARQSRNMPRGICPQVKRGVPTGKYQARLSWKDAVKGWTQRFIPNPITSTTLFDNVEEAVAALAAAQLQFDAGGVEAVWQNEIADRSQRGEVCASLAIPPHAHRLLSTCDARAYRGARRPPHGHVLRKRRGRHRLPRRRLSSAQCRCAHGCVRVGLHHPLRLCAVGGSQR